MISYIKGFFKNIGGKSSPLALITFNSRVSRLAKVWRYAKIYDSEVGSYSYIGPQSCLINTTMGKFCSVALGCKIGLGSHTLSHVSTSPIFTEKKNGTGSQWIEKDINKAISTPIIIGNDVWIGINVIIQGGVTIGDGAVIGAGAIVTKDIPPYAIAVGIPAKVIKYRFEESIRERLLEIKWWDLPEEELEKALPVFTDNKITLEKLNKYFKEK